MGNVPDSCRKGDGYHVGFQLPHDSLYFFLSLLLLIRPAAEELATTPQTSTTNKPHAYYAADDSISTLRTKGDDKTSATLPSTRFTPRASPPSSQFQEDGMSVTSGLTMETFDKVQADMAETKACLKKIMTALDIRKVSNPPDSSHNDTAGASVEDTGS